MDIESSSFPFHSGEIALQKRAAVRERVAVLGARMIRDHLTEQHQVFFAELPSLIVGSRDVSGHLWASILSAEPGFMHAADPQLLTVNAKPIEGDPLANALVEGARLGLLGIQFETRRRNRVTTTVVKVTNDGMTLGVDQSFGNCPQYIQSRVPSRVDYKPGVPSVAAHLSAADVALIQQADTFFIASGIEGGTDDPSAGQDVSHRGGRPGFVKVQGQTITWPDFPGNGHFNTLGNLQIDPRAGLLFIDFETGDTLQLTGQASVLWDSAEQAGYKGAERFVQFELESAIRIPHALPLSWAFMSESPVNKRTGIWADLEE